MTLVVDLTRPPHDWRLGSPTLYLSAMADPSCSLADMEARAISAEAKITEAKRILGAVLEAANAASMISLGDAIVGAIDALGGFDE